MGHRKSPFISFKGNFKLNILIFFITDIPFLPGRFNRSHQRFGCVCFHVQWTLLVEQLIVNIRKPWNASKKKKRCNIESTRGQGKILEFKIWQNPSTFYIEFSSDDTEGRNQKIFADKLFDFFAKLKPTLAAKCSLKKSIPVQAIKIYISGPLLLSFYLIFFFKQCLNDDTCPNLRKMANVVGIHKNGDTSVHRKLSTNKFAEQFKQNFWKLVYTRMLTYFKNLTISTEQFRFSARFER